MQEQIVSSPAERHWFYFQANDDGSFQLKAAETVTDIPAVALCPWTEAVRAADFSLTGSVPVFLINKCGVFPYTQLCTETKIPVQHELFSRATAGGIYGADGTHYVRIYQNSIFAQDEYKKNTCFLLRNNGNDSFYAVAGKPEYFNIPVEAQCTGLEQSGGKWYVSFKTDNGKEVVFDYFQCNTFDMLLQFNAHMVARPISAETFRDACKPLPYEQMPPMLKDLAGKIDIPSVMYIQLFTKETEHGGFFIKEPSAFFHFDNEPHAIQAKALAYARANGSHSAAILLPDGKLFINSSELGIRELHLPPLPEHFSYSHFFVTGTHILAAWEEQSFYEVGRSGFFTALLENLL